MSGKKPQKGGARSPKPGGVKRKAAARGRPGGRLFMALAPVLAVVVGLVFTSMAGGPFSFGGGVSTGAEKADIQVYGGVPVATSSSASFELLDNIGYDVGYSETRQNPLWVAYRVGPEGNFGKLPRLEKFGTDARTKAGVSHSDYSKSGYDRGHMAPNHAIATRYGRKAQVETFLMSNVCPQKPDLNRKVWRDIEQIESGRFPEKYGEVFVITGPVFDIDHDYLKKKQPRIEIPDAFYKIMVDELDPGEGGTEGNEKKPRVLAFLIPQDVSGDERPVEFLTSVDRIEELTGLDFMPDLSDEIENRIESEIADGIW